jgi:type I restriction enzyme M protein
LSEETIEVIAKAFDNFQTVERYCAIAKFDEIEENSYNLNISRYVDTTEQEETVDISAAIENLKTLDAEREEIQKKLAGFMKEIGY